MTNIKIDLNHTMNGSTHTLQEVMRQNQQWAEITASITPLLIVNVIVCAYLFFGLDEAILKRMDVNNKLNQFLCTKLPLLGMFFANTMNLVLLTIVI